MLKVQNNSILTKHSTVAHSLKATLNL